MKILENAGLILALGVLAPAFAFIDPRWVTPLAIGMGVLAFAHFALTRRRPPLVWLPFFLGLGMVCWSGLSTIWSITPEDTLVSAGKLAGNFVLAAALGGLALVATRRDVAVLRSALRYGFPVWLAILGAEILLRGPISLHLRGYQWQADYGPYWLIGSLTATALLAWPWLLTVPAARRLPAALAVFALLAVIGYLGDALTLVAAVLAAAACAVLCLLVPKARYLLAAAVALMVMGAPVAVEHLIPKERLGAIPATPNSFVHRTYIWEFVAKQIDARPILGRGLNSARAIPGGKLRAVDPTRGDLGQMIPLHPHQSALQIWVELGVVGAALFAAFLAWGIVVAGRTLTRESIIPLGHVMSAIILGMGSFGVWQSWWVGSIVVSTVLTVALMRAADAQDGDDRSAA